MTDEKDEKSEAVTAPDEKEVEEKKAEATEAKPAAEKKADETKKPKSDKKKKEKNPEDAYRLAPSNPVASAWKTFAGMGAVGVIGSAVAYTQDHDRMAFAWLFGFICALTVVIGSLMFVMMHHLTSGRWGIVVRRVAEILGASSWVLIVLAIPVMMTRGAIFGAWLDAHAGEHTAKEHAAMEVEEPDVRLAANDFQQPRGMPHGPMRFQPRGGAGTGGGAAHPMPHASPSHLHFGNEVEARADRVEHDEVMKSKSWFLSQSFFFGRMIFYFIIWYLLGFTLLKWSSEQDKSKDPLVSVRLRKLSAAGIVLLALTLTFAAFDWIMSLEPDVVLDHLRRDLLRRLDRVHLRAPDPHLPRDPPVGRPREGGHGRALPRPRKAPLRLHVLLGVRLRSPSSC